MTVAVVLAWVPVSSACVTGVAVMLLHSVVVVAAVVLTVDVVVMVTVSAPSWGHGSSDAGEHEPGLG